MPQATLLLFSDLLCCCVKLSGNTGFMHFAIFFPQVKFSTYIMAKKFKFAENRIKDRKVGFKNKKFKKLHYNM